MMRAPDVVAIVERLTAAGIAVWLDGGWGVDALLGEQTREHDDLDLVIALDDTETARSVLAGLGFSMIDDEFPTRLVARDRDDRRVDVHPVTFDADGAGHQRLQDGSTWRYPPAGFAGVGRVVGRSVPCLTADAQLLCHLGYAPDATDRHDMRLLADRYGLALPPPYDGV